MTATTKDRPLPPPIAGAEEWEVPDWIPSNSGLDWLDALGEQHLAAVIEWRRSAAHVADTEAAIQEQARAWRRAVRDSVAAGKEPPPREIDDALVQAQLEIAKEDSVASRDELALVVVAALAELRQPERRQELQPLMGSLSPSLRYALQTGPGGAVAQAQALLREQMERLNGEPSMVDLSDPTHAPFTGDDDNEEVVGDAS
ncbi:MAG: hypothetical protein QOI89_49 [Solirubrobacteraceae bacterium]|jgi:hypothetical protein|nr:hypothetical protein [Solirubrobacteraceae bacterium]